MLKSASISRRIGLSLALAISLLLAFAPVTLAAVHSQAPSFHLPGPKQYYLALGDSLAYGFQPDGDFSHGYVNDLFQVLQSKGTRDLKNLACPGETSTTFIKGGCPVALPGAPAQLSAAVAFLQVHAGKVSPVTLDIGADDILRDITVTSSGCTLNTARFPADLATLDSNLTGTILPALLRALTVNGRVTGSIVMMNYYDPYQNTCPASLSFAQTLNQHLAADVSRFGAIVNVFGAFGGAATPNPHICTYTWMCAPVTFPFGLNVHPTDQGYSAIARSFAAAILQN
jgi:lysophospholipase L1-like esterase